MLHVRFLPQAQGSIGRAVHALRSLSAVSHPAADSLPIHSGLTTSSPSLSSTTRRQSGQIAVVILLISVVLMTLGLSLVTRTTQEIFLSQQEAESARVFNAAEAGVEDALSQSFTTLNDPNNPLSQTLDETATGINDSTVDYTIQPVASLETTIAEGAAATIYVGSTNNSVTIDWGKSTTPCTNASLIISLYYDHPGPPSAAVRSWYESKSPNGCTRFPDDEFDTTGVSDPNSDDYHNRFTFNISDAAIGGGVDITPLFIRIRPVYADTQLRVTGASLPVQQHVIRSTGSNDIGNEQRVIEVQRTVDSPPSIMDYALYSGDDIVK